LVERPTAVVEELLESGAVHCGFCIVPTINGDHETLLLPREEVHAFLHKDHPLAAKDALTIEDLATTKLITFTNETTLYRSIIRNFQAREMRPQIAIQAYEWSLLAAFADANVGVTLLPEPLGRFVPQLYPNLVDRPLVDTDLAWRAALVWQDKRYAGTVVELFVEFFRMHQGLDTAASAAHKK
ncbi:MAG: LysR substrate-binding domain-containing protein, partial [Negativicoccus succinicivorans]|nr:LysR substrate-binding domain-containing protein [Negativicoccus succinicivorans]